MIAGQLIALDKCPGIYPIGVGKSLRHILCKAVSLATQADLEDVCGVVGLCSGLRTGIEGAIYVSVSYLICTVMTVGGFCLLMQEMLLHNSVNRVVALWNARFLCLCCSQFLFNSYQGYAKLFNQGSDLFCLVRKV